MNDELVLQVADELSRLAGALCNVIGDIDLGIAVERRAVQSAPMLADQLVDDDAKLVAQTVIDLMCAIWPRSDPDPEWWQTPLGRACARSLGRDDGGEETVTYARAAEMLGVSTGTVAQWAHRGTLERHPDGKGIMLSSVLARLGR